MLVRLSHRKEKAVGFISKQQKRFEVCYCSCSYCWHSKTEHKENHYKIKMKVALHWFPLGKKMSFINPGGLWIKRVHPLLWQWYSILSNRIKPQTPFDVMSCFGLGFISKAFSLTQIIWVCLDQSVNPPSCIWTQRMVSQLWNMMGLEHFCIKSI